MDYELREPSAWLAASPALGQYLSVDGESRVVVRPCEVTAYDEASAAYTGADADNGMAVMVPRVLLLFDGEDVGLFTARLYAALIKRDEALRLLQYQLCVRDMPTTKGDVVLPLDKIDRILQLVFNTDALKTGNVDSSELLKEVYTDFVSRQATRRWVKQAPECLGYLLTDCFVATGPGREQPRL